MNAIQQLKNNLEKGGILTKFKTLEREEYLKTANNINTNLYFISEGSLRVFYVNDKEEHTLYLGYKKSLITALDSFFSNKVSQLEIQALKKTKVDFISKDDFMKFMMSNPENLSLWYAILEELIYLQTEREIDLLISSPAERYQRVLQRRPELFQEIPHKYIASYLRMAPETLSRIKRC
ncbi:Crp/Fnr family transcriptional regulator [Aquimarina algiphila]|uniref:Crp/Fnr family transcriptional regulator n=1 Tax=Aquimarina algiphila TaxID=2047982 RepID=UPI0024938D5C|nr:Crp/Fnr family transcriptional regulator [Aquimarina algiphila]